MNPKKGNPGNPDFLQCEINGLETLKNVTQCGTNNLPEDFLDFSLFLSVFKSCIFVFVSDILGLKNCYILHQLFSKFSKGLLKKYKVLTINYGFLKIKDAKNNLRCGAEWRLKSTKGKNIEKLTFWKVHMRNL